MCRFSAFLKVNGCEYAKIICFSPDSARAMVETIADEKEKTVEQPMYQQVACVVTTRTESVTY